jgi:hypothetical protein
MFNFLMHRYDDPKPFMKATNDRYDALISMDGNRIWLVKQASCGPRVHLYQFVSVLPLKPAPSLSTGTPCFHSSI